MAEEASSNADAVLELVPAVQYYRPSYAREWVWRMRLDPHDNCIIQTMCDGTLRSLDIATGQLLWSYNQVPFNPCPHLEYSNGFIVYNVGRNGLTVCERVNRRCFNVCGTFAANPNMKAFRLHYPILATATRDDRWEEFDLAAQQTQCRHPLLLPQNSSFLPDITYIEFDEAYAFVTTTTFEGISAYNRATGKRVWSLLEHVEKFGAPRTFATDDTIPCRERHSLQLRRLREIEAPAYFQQKELRNPALARSWFAVHVDQETGTLVFAGEKGILLVPKYKDVFAQCPSTGTLYFYCFPFDGATGLSERANLTSSSMEYSQLAVKGGRVAVVCGLFVLLDLCVRTLCTNEEKTYASFAVYEWSDASYAQEHLPEKVNQFNKCSSIALDSAGVYVVTKQALHREIHVDLTAFPIWYQAKCKSRGSTMVTGFHFDGHAKAPSMVHRSVFSLPEPEPLVVHERQSAALSVAFSNGQEGDEQVYEGEEEGDESALSDELDTEDWAPDDEGRGYIW
ncbi:hypothetical protein MVES_001923 [Malassezia vespertilionis]|uniref:Uncharacterized protein n=2 Tax=Malassezia vespertilionis TaxID=2020962 RepID=A0A2N1JBS4_9BASI|nr:hypothetical protein MVES_001923 [Malassezia vespertilionis]